MQKHKAAILAQGHIENAAHSLDHFLHLILPTHPPSMVLCGAVVAFLADNLADLGSIPHKGNLEAQ